MDKTVFVQNIKKYCAVKGVKPTVACRESGLGSAELDTDLERAKRCCRPMIPIRRDSLPSIRSTGQPDAGTPSAGSCISPTMPSLRTAHC